jgi:hypothetical protein
MAPDQDERPWLRIVRPTPRAFNGKVAVRLAAMVAAAVLLGLLGLHGYRNVVGWLQGHSDYRVAFDRIVLDPPPPAYIRSGASGILDRVKRNSRQPEELETLRVDLEALGRDFALSSPWIEKVREVRVEGRPNRIRVAVDYRKPVARFPNTQLILDRGGVVLPNADIEQSELGALLWITEYRGALNVPRVGLSLLPIEGEESHNFLAGLKLAEFVLNRDANARLAGHTFWAVGLAHGATWLSLHTDDGYRISWGEAPGLESPGKPSASQKWRWLEEWFGREQLSEEARKSRFLSFTRSGVEVRDDPEPGLVPPEKPGGSG